MGKLVRDLIPALILAEGRRPVTRVLDEGEYTVALHDKLLEEATELREARREDQLEEAADVYEVLTSIARLLGTDMDAVAAKAAEKRTSRGGFAGRIWLEA